MNSKENFINLIKGKIIVSWEAVDDEPLNISLMAKSVIDGGATILRFAQEEHIKSIKKNNQISSYWSNKKKI